MNVLVLGVTGHIGNAVSRELLSRGHQVTGVSRGGRPSWNLTDVRIRHIRGDIGDGKRLDSWLKGHDAIVDAAAPYPIALAHHREATLSTLLRDIDRRTRALLKATRRRGVCLVCVSSFSTLPQRRFGIDQIATGLMRQLHPYFAVKERIEDTMLAAAAVGQPVIVVNPTGCLGPWDMKERNRCFVPALLRGEIPSSTDQMLNVIDVRDAAVGVVAALEARRSGEPIALIGHNISNDILFRWICEIGGVKAPPIISPASAGVIATYLTEMTLGAFDIETPLPALIAMLTYMHGYLTPSVAQVELGVLLRPLSATLLDTIEWYRSIGYC
jgi:dihydroflavonol-4-reductase